jgi:hypothetical protein
LSVVRASSDEFPLLDGAPRLNEQKYKTIRPPVAVCTDISIVKTILHGLGCDDD